MKYGMMMTRMISRKNTVALWKHCGAIDMPLIHIYMPRKMQWYSWRNVIYWDKSSCLYSSTSRDTVSMLMVMIASEENLTSQIYYHHNLHTLIDYCFYDCKYPGLTFVLLEAFIFVRVSWIE
jgi:hypothetical protein